MTNPDFTIVFDVPDNWSYTPMLQGAVASLVQKGAIHFKLDDTRAQPGGTPHDAIRRIILMGWLSLSGSE